MVCSQLANLEHSQPYIGYDEVYSRFHCFGLTLRRIHKRVSDLENDHRLTGFILAAVKKEDEEALGKAGETLRVISKFQTFY